MNRNLMPMMPYGEGRCLSQEQLVLLFRIPPHCNTTVPTGTMSDKGGKGKCAKLTMTGERIGPLVQCRVELCNNSLFPLLVRVSLLRP